MDNLTPITREEMLMNDEPLTPITREEKILAGEDLNPVTRREYFLKKYRHAGGDVMVEGLSVTENGTYTAPEGKAYSPVNVAVPLPENAYLLKEASGSLVSFNDGADLPMPSFICNIDAQQDLHGYDRPWVGGAGKNKAEPVVNDWTNKGITATKNDDGSYSITGTATENVTSNFLINVYPVSAGETYIVTNKKNQTDTATKYSRCVCSFYNDSTYKSEINVSEGQTITVPNGVNRIRLSYVWNNGFVVPAGAIIYPMIRLATETDSTFEPYSNICPISGHTGVDAWVRGKNLLDVSNAVNATNVVDSVETDGTIHFKDVTATWSNTHVGKIYVVKGQTYSMSASNIQYGRFGVSTSPTIYPTTSTFPNITIHESGGSPSWVISRTRTTCHFDANFTGYIYLFYCSDANYDSYHATFAAQIQIEIGETATTYEPYNPNSQTIQVSWQTEAGEVFGGYVDLVSGVLTVTHKSQTGFTRGSQDSTNKLYNIGTIFGMTSFSGGGISPYFINSMFEKMSLAGARAAETPCITQYTNTLYVGGYIGKEAELGTLLESLQVKYELKTPLTYQLTPTQIKSLLGNNNAWCSTGDVNIDYFAKEVTE